MPANGEEVESGLAEWRKGLESPRASAERPCPFWGSGRQSGEEFLPSQLRLRLAHSRCRTARARGRRKCARRRWRACDQPGLRRRRQRRGAAFERLRRALQPICDRCATHGIVDSVCERSGYRVLRRQLQPAHRAERHDPGREVLPRRRVGRSHWRRDSDGRLDRPDADQPERQRGQGCARDGNDRSRLQRQHHGRVLGCGARADRRSRRLRQRQLLRGRRRGTDAFELHGRDSQRWWRRGLEQQQPRLHGPRRRIRATAASSRRRLRLRLAHATTIWRRGSTRSKAPAAPHRSSAASA